ncbi:cytochrome P450 family protein [Streptomyces sp. NBC_01233]|uniref:cytochrome P450 family protein n=1 Tax=Streptomyces sp. NBC_01233 TaxID=2903787 RepID=UPI002E12F24D|nr:cytochrome P450 [Streptomyces sp. NBC_01233]
MADPYGMLAEIREATPAFAIENNGYRMWAITRYHDVRKVLADPTVLRDLVENRHAINSHCIVRQVPRAHLPHGSRRSFFDRDGENHHRLRSLVGNVFTPVRLAQLQPRVERLANELADTLPVGEPVDLAAAFARPIAGTIICELLGIPPNEQNMLAASESEMITSPIISEIEKAVGELHVFATNLATAKRERPGDDLSTRLLHLHEDAKMTEDELISTYILLMVGGMEPSSAIGNGAFALLTNPGELAKVLTDPELFTDCVDEIVRYESPFRFVPPRYTTAAVELDGVTIPAGELLLISLAAANRDPARFGEPDVFDIERNTTGHLGFGHGVHRCLGSELGKIEAATALRTLFQRFPGTRLIDPPEQARWRPGKFMRRLDALPVVLQ